MLLTSMISPVHYHFVILVIITSQPNTKTRKGVSELRGPALVCFSALDKKMA